jgi:hypothetical protein
MAGDLLIRNDTESSVTQCKLLAFNDWNLVFIFKRECERVVVNILCL